MATSEPNARVVIGATLVCVALCVAACGQVTGLSDEYRYDLASDAASAEDAGQPALDGAVDAAKEAGGRCVGADRTRAATSINDANGSSLPAQCSACLAESCCAQIQSCASNTDCQKAMRCVFACQRSSGGGNKADCLQNCDSNFMQTLGTCLQSDCAAPTCQLQ